MKVLVSSFTGRSLGVFGRYVTPKLFEGKTQDCKECGRNSLELHQARDRYLSSVGDRASSYPGAAPRQSFFSGTPYMRLKDRGASLTPERSTLDVELAVHFHELIGASVAPRPTLDHQT
jgi:hypothetical protein